MEACRSFTICDQQNMSETRFSARTALTAILCAGLCACGESRWPAAPPPQALLQCDQTLKIRFIPDSTTKIVAVKAFKADDPITPAGTPDASYPVIAKKDMCLVKLLAGPGNPETPERPSTSNGIGMEIWLPSRLQNCSRGPRALRRIFDWRPDRNLDPIPHEAAQSSNRHVSRSRMRDGCCQDRSGDPCRDRLLQRGRRAEIAIHIEPRPMPVRSVQGPDSPVRRRQRK